MIEMNAVAVGTELDAARDAGREGVSAGWCAWSAGEASLTFSLVVRPDVNMHAFHGLPFVAAMGMMDALAGTAAAPGLGLAGKVGIQWPSDIVCGAPAFETSFARVAVNGGAGLARVDAWAVVANTPQGAAGPLAPVLGEYFDMVPLLGRQVAAVSPNGLPLAVGVFAGLDIWGRATIKTDAGEQEFPPEAVRIRGL